MSINADLDELFEDDGVLERPTMRGSANLDIQDYANSGGDDDFLDDGLQEDVPSRPGSGAAAAPDIDGTSSFQMLEESGSPDDVQTTYGAHPWGPGAGSGYRPMSMSKTDLSGNEDANGTNRAPNTNVERVPPPRMSQQNRMPSNASIDPETIYDRESYEYDDSSQDTIGSGIFDMQEGVTFRARDGQFAHQYALPAYIADEDELGVQQSEMWDTTAEEWRVVQPSGGGVTFSRQVPALRGRGAYSPFASRSPQNLSTRPATSSIERFGRDAAKAIVNEAADKTGPVERSQFLTNAIESLGPGMASRCHAITSRLVSSGVAPREALEDTVAHCVMHAAVRDLSTKRAGAQLPRVDAMAAHVQKNKQSMVASAAKNIAPLSKDPNKLKADVAKLYQSPAAAGMGEIANEQGAPASTTAAPTAVQAVADGGSHTLRNVIIGAAVIGLGYVALKHTETGQEIVANVGSAFGVKKRRRARRKRAKA